MNDGALAFRSVAQMVIMWIEHWLTGSGFICLLGDDGE